MKLNNKGFAISSVMFSLLILAVSLMFGILAILVSRKMTLDKIKENVRKTVNGDIIVVPEDYKGITPKAYSVGDQVTYANLDWTVVKDNGNNVTLVLNSSIDVTGYTYDTYKTDLADFITNNPVLAIAKKNGYLVSMTFGSNTDYVKTLSVSDIYGTNPIPTTLSNNDSVLPSCRFCAATYNYYLLDSKDTSNVYMVNYDSNGQVNYLYYGNNNGVVRPVITIKENN